MSHFIKTMRILSIQNLSQAAYLIFAGSELAVT